MREVEKPYDNPPEKGKIVYLCVQTPFQASLLEKRTDIIKGKWLGKEIGFLDELDRPLYVHHVTVRWWADIEDVEEERNRLLEQKASEKEEFEKSCLRKLVFTTKLKSKMKETVDTAPGLTGYMRECLYKLIDLL